MRFISIKKITVKNIPLLLFIFTLVIFAYKMYISRGGDNTFKKKEEKNLEYTSNNNTQEELSTWKTYNNTNYRFVIKIPNLLLERVYTGQQDYLFFVKFEENKFSEEKGVALGVTDRTVAQEVEKIRTDMAKDFSINPKESNIKVDGQDAVRIDYEKVGELEARSVVVVRGNDVTISVSTVPEQIERLIKSIDFY
jgi:hypothetical protein